jgi:DNA-binding CsgD family transcriptional regulator
MKAYLQSHVVSLEIGSTSGTCNGTSGFICRSWNAMPDYALEYIPRRDQVSSCLDEQTGINLQFPAPMLATAAQSSVLEMPTGETYSAPKIEVKLTPRQREIFELIVQGMSNKEIARALQLAEGTVKIHIKALFKKLGVRRRAAVAMAGRRLLSTPERSTC